MTLKLINEFEIKVNHVFVFVEKFKSRFNNLNLCSRRGELNLFIVRDEII